MAGKNTPPVPPLSVPTLRELDQLEKQLRRFPSDCFSATGGEFSEPKAAEYLRAYVVEIFDLYLNAAKTFADYTPQWERELKKLAVYRAMVCLQNEVGFGPQRMSAYKLALEDTVAAHIKRKKEPPAPPVSGKPRSLPAALYKAYVLKFPDVKIADICWAAKQDYREWKRWNKGQVKSGGIADRSFRHVLTSGKHTSELRPGQRPKTRT